MVFRHPKHPTAVLSVYVIDGLLHSETYFYSQICGVKWGTAWDLYAPVEKKMRFFCLENIIF